ncbi:hypothetical protein FRACYDRAFT_218197 [Fragilariopsis cylindrus CCMP1102]|uniref:Peptidase M41 domain-containing protein n=1 Tax=Fragilariopsis cylindrus CCMP1102 TaxID=635003 RepID=A0A1E7FAJ2_9STRA|nr:hypothetical protein FRACYDRAFT_218197 [Fragilariopsis cylindrus CCMP1102]|eukprot:OEU15202.1 hypothetical protein FRACYDRAFT_218197 [Fragilariopsis cylindrus CCMP1102]
MAIANNMELAKGFAPISITTIAPNNAISAESIILRNSRTISSSSSLGMSSSSAQDEITRLRAAAAKAREEAAVLSKELGKDDTDSSNGTTATTAKPATPSKSPEEIQSAIRSIDFNSGLAGKQVSALGELRNEGSISIYKSATEENGSGDLRSFPVSLSMLENRCGLTSEKLGIGEEIVSLDDFKYGTLWVTGGASVAGIASLALLPENVGATFCYFFALLPILWLGVGSTVPAAIAGAIVLIRGDDDDGSVSKTERVCRHEAAHFLCGYLCGLPVANYETSEDIPRVEFHYSQDGNENIATANRELKSDEINALTVVALSGAVAEAMSFGKAKGGSNADLMELQNIFRKSEIFLGAEKQQDLTRWGALTAYRLLNTNKTQLDALVKAFSEQKSVADCVAIIEQQ